MICPNCRSEVGYQPSCPYCGRILIPDAYYSTQSRERTAPVTTQQIPSARSSGNHISVRAFSRQINMLELRTKLTLVMLAGVFVLQLIILILLAFK